MRGTSRTAAAILFGLAWLKPCLAWHYVGLSGHNILSVDNHSRDNCVAASDQALFRGYSRGGWWDTLYRYGQHPGTRACVRAQGYELDTVFLAWGWGSRSDGLWLTRDGGISWSELRYMLFPSIVALGQERSNIVFLGSDTLEQGLWRSTDEGQNWSRADSCLPTTNVRTLALFGASDSQVWCGTVGHGLYLSTNLGRSWRVAGPDSLMDVRGVGGDYTGFLQVVGDVAPNPSSSGIWCSTDFGATWAHEFTLDSGLCTAPGRHAGFRCGMYWKSWQDSIWEPAPGWPPGLPATCISGWAFLYAGSTDGVYHLDLTPGSEESPKPQARGSKPGATVVRGVLLMPGASGPAPHAAGRLLDISGRRVLDLLPGANDVRHLAPGIYLVRPVAGGDNQTTKVVLAR